MYGRQTGCLLDNEKKTTPGQKNEYSSNIPVTFFSSKLFFSVFVQKNGLKNVENCTYI